MANLRPLYYDAEGNQIKVPNANDVIISSPDVTFNTIADLKAYDIYSNAGTKTAEVLGYYAPNDGGGGFFNFVSDATDADNGGTLIRPTAYTTQGVWKRLFDSEVSVLWFGVKGDGVTDDRSAIQNCFDYVGGSSKVGKIFFPETGTDYLTSGDLVVKGDTRLEWLGNTSYLKITANTTGGLLGMELGANVDIVNPRIDGGGNSPQGQNGIGGAKEGNLNIYGGHIKNCYRGEGDGSGGKAIGIDGSSTKINISNIRITNCFIGMSFKRDAVTDSSVGVGMSISASNFFIENCSIAIHNQIRNATYSDGIEMSVSLSNFNIKNCGFYANGGSVGGPGGSGNPEGVSPSSLVQSGGVFLFSRSSNIKINNFSVSGSQKVDAIFRGRTRNSIIDGGIINQDALAIINIDPYPLYAEDTSLMSNNRYNVTTTGLYDYVYYSDLTDSTFSNRFLNNSTIDVILNADVTNSIVTPATRNGSTLLTVRLDNKTISNFAPFINTNYTTMADAPTGFIGIDSGEWTPEYRGSTGSAGSVAYVSNSGNYIRVGDTVTCSGVVRLSNKGSWTGVVEISNLPFNVKSGTAFFGSVAIENATFNADEIYANIEIGTGSLSRFRILVTRQDTTFSFFNTAKITDTSSFRFTITYRTN